MIGVTDKQKPPTKAVVITVMTCVASDYVPILDDELNVESNYADQWSPAGDAA